MWIGCSGVFRRRGLSRGEWETCSWDILADFCSVILDVEAWRLLYDVCAGTPKSALVSILGRANTAPVLQSALKNLCQCSSEIRTSVLAILRLILSTIWPIVSAKLSCDVLLDLFGHTLRVTSIAESEDVDAILAQISVTFTASLVHASNKKKVRHAEVHLPPSRAHNFVGLYYFP